VAKTATAILTGDLINSKKEKPDIWLPLLKGALAHFGKEPVAWEIFRGDSFQLEVRPSEALFAAIYIKAAVKQQKHLDVRIGIGIGEKSYAADRITESNGTAFVYSGECFDQLKKQTMAVKTSMPSLDEQVNQLLSLALLTMNNWPPATSLAVKTALENPALKQNQLAEKLQISQSSVSEALQRGGFEEINHMITYFSKLIPA
jgi:hypothetical protein